MTTHESTTTDAWMTACHAIAQSVAEDRIVTLEHDPAVRAALETLSDDSVEGHGTTELWGQDGAGYPWRVHVRDRVRACPYDDDE